MLNGRPDARSLRCLLRINIAPPLANRTLNPPRHHIGRSLVALHRPERHSVCNGLQHCQGRRQRAGASATFARVVAIWRQDMGFYCRPHGRSMARYDDPGRLGQRGP
jgi:hypothetical protein